MSDIQTTFGDSNPTSGINVQRDGHQDVQHSTADIDLGNGYLANATSPQGSRVVGREVREDDRIRTEAGEMLVSTALAHGFLRRDASGRLIEVDSSSPQHPVSRKACENAARDRTAAALADASALDVDASVTTVLTNLSAAAMDVGINPVSVVSEVLASPTHLPKSIETICEAKGLSLEEARSELNATIHGLGTALGQRFNIPTSQLDAFFSYVAETVDRTTLTHMWIETVFGGQTAQWQRHVDGFRREGSRRATNEAAQPSLSIGKSDGATVDIVIAGQTRTVSRAFARAQGLI
jgi:hypothetical protein